MRLYWYLTGNTSFRGVTFVDYVFCRDQNELTLRQGWCYNNSVFYDGFWL